MEAIVSILIIGITIMIVVSNVRDNEKYNQNGDPIETGTFCIRESLLIRNTVCICCGLFSLLLLLCVVSFKRIGVTSDNLFAFFVFLFFVISSFLFSLYVQNKAIYVDQERITYTNWVGKNKIYNFKEVEVKKTKHFNLQVYKNKKKIFSIDANAREYADFLWWANKYGVYRM